MNLSNRVNSAIFKIIKSIKSKKGVDTGLNNVTNLTKLSKNPQALVEMEKLGEKQESAMNSSKNSDQHGGHETGQHGVLGTKKPHEPSEKEKSVDKNKRELECKGLLIEIKMWRRYTTR